MNLKPTMLLLLMVLLAACSSQAAEPSNPATPGAARTLTVLAAASLTESFGELGKLFEARYPNVKVTFNFAGSQQLAQQLDQGAGADVFASASSKNMEMVVQARRIERTLVRNFTKNRLVVIYPKGGASVLKDLRDLAKPGLKLVLADPAVPVGQYSLDFLDKALKDPNFGPIFKEDVLKNVVSYEDNVKAVVTKVALDEADAGIVYASDVVTGLASRIAKLDIPDALNTVAVYPIAPILDSQNANLAKGFVDLVLSPDGQQVMEKYGFGPAGD